MAWRWAAFPVMDAPQYAQVGIAVSDPDAGRPSPAPGLVLAALVTLVALALAVTALVLALGREQGGGPSSVLVAKALAGVPPASAERAQALRAEGVVTVAFPDPVDPSAFWHAELGPGLVGPAGAAGPNGTRGANGTAGEAGGAGPPGDPGFAGLRGENGTAGTDGGAVVGYEDLLAMHAGLAQGTGGGEALVLVVSSNGSEAAAVPLSALGTDRAATVTVVPLPLTTATGVVETNLTFTPTGHENLYTVEFSGCSGDAPLGWAGELPVGWRPASRTQWPAFFRYEDVALGGPYVETKVGIALLETSGQVRFAFVESAWSDTPYLAGMNITRDQFPDVPSYYLASVGTIAPVTAVLRVAPV